MTRLKIGVLQSHGATVSGEQRLQELADTAAKLADDNGELLLCCELFVCGYGPAEQVRKYADSADGQLHDQIAAIARRNSLAIAYGYPEQHEQSLFNSLQVIGANGNTLANYRKRLLPPGFETEVFATGDRSVSFTLGGVRCSVLICFDVEFPELVRQQAFNETELLLVPTALTTPWNVVADHLIPARAFENSLYIAYADFCGHNEVAGFCGSSCIVGPTGDFIARAGTRNTSLLVATIDTAEVAKARATFDYIAKARSFYRA